MDRLRGKRARQPAELPATLLKRLLVDTNILSALVKGDAPARDRLKSAMSERASVILSPVVNYELRRGLLERDQILFAERYDSLRKTFLYADLTSAEWHRAAAMWTFAKQRGRLTEDADLLIASQALSLDATLVTDNTKHFEVFKPLGLKLDNWKEVKDDADGRADN